MATKIVTVKGRLRANGTRGPSTRRKMKRIRNKLGKMQWVFAKGKATKATKKAAKKSSKSSKSSKSGGNSTTKKNARKIPILTLAGTALGLWNLWTKMKVPIANRDVTKASRQFIHAITGYSIWQKKFTMEDGGGMTTLAPLAGYGAGQAMSKISKGKIGQGIPFIALR